MNKKYLMELTRKWIEQEYGKRCSAYSFCCPTCEIWLAYDRLFNNPVSGYSWMEELQE